MTFDLYAAARHFESGHTRNLVTNVVAMNAMLGIGINASSRPQRKKSVKIAATVLLALLSSSAIADEVARQFASVAAGKVLSESDPKVVDADAVLKDIARSCRESTQVVSDMLAKAQSMLKSSGVNQPLLPMAHGISYAATPNCGGVSVAEVVSVYVVTRKNGNSHKDSVLGTQEFLSSMPKRR